MNLEVMMLRHPAVVMKVEVEEVMNLGVEVVLKAAEVVDLVPDQIMILDTKEGKFIFLMALLSCFVFIIS